MSTIVIDDRLHEVIFHLKEHYGLSYRQIATYLHRHYKVNVSYMSVYRLLNS